MRDGFFQNLLHVLIFHQITCCHKYLQQHLSNTDHSMFFGYHAYSTEYVQKKPESATPGELHVVER